MLQGALAAQLELRSSYASIYRAAADGDLGSCFKQLEELIADKTSVDWGTMRHVGHTIGTLSDNAVDDAYFVLEGRLSDGDPVSVESLNLIIAGCAEIGDISRAIETFDEISARFDCAPDLRSYEFVLRSCLNAGNTQNAVAFLGEMQAQQVAPDEGVYNTMLEVLASVVEKSSSAELRHNAAALEKLLQDMHEASVDPSSDALAATATAFAAQKRFKDAWNAVNKMRSQGYRIEENLVTFIKNGGTLPNTDSA